MHQEIQTIISNMNSQRLKLAVILEQIILNKNSTGFELRTNIAVSILNILQTNMNACDRPMIDLLENCIKIIVDEAEDLGYSDFKQTLNLLANDFKDKAKRIKIANDIIDKIV